MSTDQNSWDLKAAEYVLGMVNDKERAVYDALYNVDSDWQIQVERWLSQLNSLHESTPAVGPPEHILPAVLARIQTDHRRAPATQSIQASATALLTPAQWLKRLRRWQFATALAVAVIVGVLVLNPLAIAPTTLSNDIIRTVAVLQGENNEPLWTVAYHAQADDESSIESVTITVVGEPQQTDTESHQLWMVLPDGADVQSVGLVPNKTGKTATLTLPVALKDATEFAISLEPSGAVPGPAHGPVVTRDFIIREPSQTGL